MRILSLGAGVQSSALLLASDAGLVERFDHALFSDTGSENPRTYAWLEALGQYSSIPIEVVRRGPESLGEHIYNNLGKFRMDNPPFFTRDSGGEGNAPLMQKCTREFKSYPLERRMRTLAGFKRGQRIAGVVVENARGISLDEAHRMKPSSKPWIRVVYPLIEKLQWNRAQCEEYVIKVTGRRPPKSACVFCPHTNPKRWLDLARYQGDVFDVVSDLDEAIREGVPYAKGKCYIHRYRMPLRAAVHLQQQQPTLPGIDDFGDECEGLCGV